MKVLIQAGTTLVPAIWLHADLYGTTHGKYGQLEGVAMQVSLCHCQKAICRSTFGYIMLVQMTIYQSIWHDSYYVVSSRVRCM